MKKLILILLFILSGIRGHAGNSNASGALTVDYLDTVIFDLSQASCTANSICIPVSFLSDDVVNALDFSFKFNQPKMTYSSMVNYKAYLTAGANYNPVDSFLRFTSFSLSQIENNSQLVAICFDVLSGAVTAADFNTIHVYLNGDPCSYKFINSPIQSAGITAGGPTTFSSGDSVTLCVTAGTGFSYLWSNGATTQCIVEHSTRTDSVTITNAGGCSATFSVNVVATPVLPITLIEFSAAENSNGISLDWITATEVNNDYFTIEKASVNLKWNVLSKINGAGNSTVYKSYSTFDYTPSSGINYYRLKQTDYNGDSKYSEIISQYFSGKEDEAAEVTVYPNPANEKIYVSVSENSNIQLSDMDGKQILLQENIKAGEENEINLRNISNGIYMMKVYNDHFLTVKRIVINK